jgi:hypothetical protein
VPALRANLLRTEAAIADGPQFTALARQFHELLVSCCGNETLIVAFGALESLWSEQEQQWASRAASEGVYPEERYRRDVLSAHVAVVAAITDGDAETAGRLDASHLQHSQRYTIEGQRTRSCALRHSVMDGPTSASSGGRKRQAWAGRPRTLGRQFLTGGSGCDCGQLGAGIDERT